MKITKRNAVLCLLWVVFVLSMPIYAIWSVFNHKHLYSWTEKFCGFLKKSNNSKTMETTKEEMIRLLRELQDLQMWLMNRDSKSSLILRINGNRKIFASVVGIIYRSVNVYERRPFNENVANLEDFMDFVKEKEYECKKNETNRTPVGKARV